MSALSSTVAVRFPRVLAKLDYVANVARREIVLDGQDAVHWYCNWATDGIKYERIAQVQNTLQPNSLTQANISNLANLRGRGWSWATLMPFVDQPLPELERIPVDASLFTSNAHDEGVIRLVNRFCKLSGIKLANSTKLLYQKRPGLIPILDVYARQVFDLPWLAGDADDCSSVLRMAFSHLREFERMNAKALDQLQEWADSEMEQSCGLRFSRLRIIDMLAWGAIKRAGL